MWECWTTGAGVNSFFAPGAKIDLRVDGRYLMYFLPEAPPGSRGSEGCKVLALQAPECLVFSWNFPPSIPELRDSGAQTQVEIKLEKIGKKTTRVRLRQTGWKTGAAWEKGFVYFNDAWSLVLERLKRRFETGPIDWENSDSG